VYYIFKTLLLDGWLMLKQAKSQDSNQWLSGRVFKINFVELEGKPSAV